MFCVAIVILGWLALIITVVALVLVYPSCRDPGSRSWWQTEAVYRIYVPSFKDSDADGVGDLAGMFATCTCYTRLSRAMLVACLSEFYGRS